LSEWKLAIREKTKISLLVLDLDNFKKCNAIFGHLMGDTVLQNVAKIIGSAPRRPTDFSARWGGEEFVILLPNADIKGAADVAERVRQNVYDLHVLTEDRAVTRISVSIGINSVIPISDAMPADFIEKADQALYKAKAGGRNRVAVIENAGDTESGDADV
jgi:diguanylate cyclase (GGDEF)-like protein